MLSIIIFVCVCGFLLLCMRSYWRVEAIPRRRLFDIHARRQAHRFAVVG